MNSRPSFCWLMLVAVGMSACTPSMHIGYDFGRAYTSAFMLQSDLTRPSSVNADYPLYGIEATEIRLNFVEEAGSDEASDMK